jgi:uncharacterized protein
VVASNPLIIDLDRIPEGQPLAVSFADSLPQFLEVLRSIAESKGAEVFGAAELQLESWPGRVDVTGHINVTADTTCVRCLHRFPLKFEREIVHILVRSLGRHDGDEEMELQSNDLDRSLIIGTSVDLAEVLREELLLGMPMKALCDADCKGICVGCGIELNTESCTCEPEADERWSALAALSGNDN